MDTIREKHKCLINGLTHLFTLFVKAHYISSTDVLYPPQDVDVGRFHRLGFEPEVIDLVQLLPVLRDEAIWGYNEEGVEMIPRAKLVNYLKQPEADVGDDMLQRLRWVDHRDKDRQGIFPPSILRLTFPAFYGVNVLYDIHDRTLFPSLHFLFRSRSSS
jgi:predicted transcriptional regulator